MKKTIIPTKHELNILSKLNSGDTMTLMRLLKEQPPDGFEFLIKLDNDWVAFYNNEKPVGENAITIPLQFHVGATIGVREAWWHKLMPYDEYFFKSDYSNEAWWHKLMPYDEYFFKSDCSNTELIYLKAKGGIWLSPATMPNKAIRKHLTVKVNKVKRVQAIDSICMNRLLPQCLYATPKEIKNAFINHWNSLYAKPRKQGDRYVCYPWESEMDINPKYLNINKDGSFTHKSKPLIIHANPFIELPIFKVKRWKVASVTKLPKRQT